MKSKFSMIITLLLIFQAPTFSQGWETIFPSDTLIGTTGWTMGLDVEQSLDGGYLMAGNVSYPTGAPRDFNRLVKTDALGNKLWQHTYDDEGINYESVTYLKEFPDGRILLAGTQFSSPHVKITDSNGDIISKKTFSSDTSYVIMHGAESPNEGFILMGTFYIDNFGVVELVLLKFDNDGNLLWKKSQPLTTIGTPSAVVVTPDGGFAIVGTLNLEISLTKLNSAGELVWNQSYQTSDNDFGYSIQLTPDNGFIIGGSSHGLGNNHFPVMLKTDSLGAAEWVEVFVDNLSGGITDIELTPDGGFVATGSIKEIFTFTNTGFILKTDSMGQVEWSKNFTNDNQKFAAVKNTNDGGFILAGQFNGEMLLKKIGGTTTTSLEKTFLNSNLEVFPNPMKDQTLFKFDDFDFTTKHLQIFDSKGSLVFEETFSDNTYIFYGKNFNNGIYFYQIKNEGNLIGNGKLVVKK